jgi:hypothetical protein
MRSLLVASLLAALAVPVLPAVAQRPVPVAAARPVVDSVPRARAILSPLERRHRELRARGILIGGSAGMLAGIVWGVRRCTPGRGCPPVVGHVVFALSGQVAGFGAGAFAGALAGEAVFLARPRAGPARR